MIIFRSYGFFQKFYWSVLFVRRFDTREIRRTVWFRARSAQTYVRTFCNWSSRSSARTAAAAARGISSERDRQTKLHSLFTRRTTPNTCTCPCYKRNDHINQTYQACGEPVDGPPLVEIIFTRKPSSVHTTCAFSDCGRPVVTSRIRSEAYYKYYASTF